MKSRESLIRLRKFAVDEKRQKLAGIEAMILDFKNMVGDLEHQIEMEQQRAGVDDINHYAYPTFAKAAIERRDNLLTSIQDLEQQFAMAEEELNEAVKDLKNVEIVEERNVGRQQRKQNRDEQSKLDEFAQNMSRLEIR